MSVEKIYLDDSIARFKEMKRLAEKAIAQINDEDFLRIVVDESNSVATIVKHISGNLRSRWTDFLTTERLMNRLLKSTRFQELY